jgi:hypothetical protein
MTDEHDNPLPICVPLCERDAAAALLLITIVAWHRDATATIPNHPGTWVTRRREWWVREVGLTPNQYNRCMRKLKKLGLVEKRVYWIDGVSSLHLRPSKKTIEALAG